MSTSVEIEDWRHRAACRDADPNAMQPEVASPAEVDAAKALCVECPVRAECRGLALSQVTHDGVSAAYGVHDGEWWGAPPRLPALMACTWCGGPRQPSERPTGRYCSRACQQRAYRARQAVCA